MSTKKELTVNYLKQSRTASESGKEGMKKYVRMRKEIKNALKESPKTVPEIAEATGLPVEDVTFYLMSMRKYGEVEAGEPDDMDEFFYYKLK